MCDHGVGAWSRRCYPKSRAHTCRTTTRAVFEKYDATSARRPESSPRQDVLDVGDWVVTRVRVGVAYRCQHADDKRIAVAMPVEISLQV